MEFTEAFHEAEEDGGPPYATVRTIPVSIGEIRQHLPVLFVESLSGEVAPSREALAWARASLAGFSPSQVDANVQVLARFINFYRVWAHGRELAEGDFDYLLYAYLIHRKAGTLDVEGRCSTGGLNWRPIAFASLAAEFRALVRFFRFCAATWGHVNITPDHFRASEDDPAFKRMAAHENRKESDFFAHLAAARDHWQSRHGGDLKMPPISKPPPKAQTVRRFPTTEEVWGVINSESNPVLKSLWLVAAFGGLRISEQLNAWQADILHGSARRDFFNDHHTSRTNTILFLRTDPIESRYIGDIGKKGPTRRQHLIEQYNLLPRKLLPPSDPMYAGWKGTVYSGDFLTHQVFWIDEHAASLFAECASEIRQFHRQHQTSRRHPWYYVNLADPTGEYRGEPIKISRIEKALDQAYRRIGLEPHRWGRNPHGFRHYYKHTVENELNLGPQHIQVMLGHRSITSQQKYGRSHQTANQILQEAMQNRKHLLTRI